MHPVVLLVGGLVLLIDHDEAELFDDAQQIGAARGRPASEFRGGQSRVNG